VNIPAPPGGLRSWPLYIMVVLTAINFLNYIDQRLLSAVLESIKTEWTLTDTEGGLLGSAFVIAYTVAAPIGYLGDRLPRKNLIAAGVLLWSLATIAGSMARDYHELLISRALLGVGEACYATIAPSIIADLFSKDQRGRKLALFYLATPVGSALGYILGGFIGRGVRLAGGVPVRGCAGDLVRAAGLPHGRAAARGPRRRAEAGRTCRSGRRSSGWSARRRGGSTRSGWRC
jgi:MFS family permease